MNAYTVRPLKFDEKLVKDVMARRSKGEPIAAIATALKVGAGNAAMAELIGTTERKRMDDPAKLAKAIVKDRKAGASWGKLAARYGVTEGTTRAAFEAATGDPSPQSTTAANAPKQTGTDGWPHHQAQTREPDQVARPLPRPELRRQERDRARLPA